MVIASTFIVQIHNTDQVEAITAGEQTEAENINLVDARNESRHPFYYL